MSCFLLNEFDEVMLQIPRGMDFRRDFFFVVDETEKTAKLVCAKKSENISFVHQEIIDALKKKLKLLVVEYDEKFMVTNTKEVRVLFREGTVK